MRWNYQGGCPGEGDGLTEVREKEWEDWKQWISSKFTIYLDDNVFMKPITVYNRNILIKNV